MVDVTKVKKVTLTAAQTSCNINYCRDVNLNPEIKYEFDTVVIRRKDRGEVFYVNQIGEGLIVDFEYVTDESMVDKLFEIYNKFKIEKQKHSDAPFQYSYEIKNERIQVTDLQCNSTPSCEIFITPSNVHKE